MSRIEFDELCKSCGGVGLYVGCCERDGIAVVCNTCNGTGKHHFIHEYEEFTEKKIREDIERVIQTSTGVIVGKINDDISWVGGMSYKDWFNGKKFEIGMEMRSRTCPAWYYQSVDYDRKPNWNECCSFGSFSSCVNFVDKHKCWERWDKEFGNKK